MRKLWGIIAIWVLTLSTAFAATTASSGLHNLYQPAGNAIEGNPKGSITVVEFFDYNCGYCRMMYPNLKKLVSEDNDVRLIFREYPVLSPKSVLPAEAAIAAQKQGKYLALHDEMMDAAMPLSQNEIVKLAKMVGINTDQLLRDMQSPAVVNQVQTNLNVGQGLNIQGVPTFIVVRTTPPSTKQPNVVVGPSISELKDMIQQAKDSA